MVDFVIWRLATGNSYRCISKVFGISNASIITIWQVFNETLTNLSSQFIIFPKNGDETHLAIDSFHIT